jgi:glucose-6-phosphate isomerase
MPSRLLVRGPRQYDELKIRNDKPLYTQFVENPDALQWVSEPQRAADAWKNFEL